MTFNHSIRNSCLAALISLFLALPALAMDLGEAKNNGLVGETATGYLAVVKSSPEINALVQDINAKRKAQYQKIAEKNKISLEAVEVRAGQKAIAKTAPGQFINSGDGWERK